MSKPQAEPITGRPVNIVSLSFCDVDLPVVLKIVEQEAIKLPDLILLPETFRGEKTDTLDSMTIQSLTTLAKKYATYLVCPIYREHNGQRYNSTIVIERNGSIGCIYDKMYPYWEEFNLKPITQVGKRAVTYDTDFGKIGLATCFDVNFPHLWDELANQGAELVLWSSAYSAGTSLQAHALNHHYYIVTSTLARDCLAYDITGELIHASQDPEINIARLTCDLDRGIYHQNYNLEKLSRLLSETDGKIIQEKWLEQEQWFVLKATFPGISARKTAKQYGLEELRDYLRRSRFMIDRMRKE